MADLVIKRMDDPGRVQFYLFEDLATQAFPDDETISNVEFEQLFGKWLVDRGFTMNAQLARGDSRPWYTGVLAPTGRVHFDSEGGMFEAHVVVHEADYPDQQVPAQRVRASEAMAWVVERLREFMASPEAKTREQNLVEAARKAKALVDPDREPYHEDRGEQISAMRDVASGAWGLLADALRPYEEER